MSKPTCAWLSMGMLGHFADPINFGWFVAQVKAEGVNVMHSPYQWSDDVRIAAEIEAAPTNARIVVGGASLGDNETLQIANMLVRHKRTVDLAFGFQRSVFGEQFKVPSNVLRAIEIHCPNIFADPFGDDPWVLEDGNTVTKLKNIPIIALHPGDFGQGAAIILAAIRQVVNQPAINPVPQAQHAPAAVNPFVPPQLEQVIAPAA